MPEKSKKNVTKSRLPSNSAEADAILKKNDDEPAPEIDKIARERFAEDVLTRGEAAKPTEEGKLPLDATHAVTKENPDGSVEIKTVRYKAF